MLARADPVTAGHRHGSCCGGAWQQAKGRTASRHQLSTLVYGSLVLDHDEIVRLYGPWRSRSPKDVAEVFNGYDGLWWIAGGWAIEAFTRVSRSHGDVDASIPRADVSGLRRHLRGRLDVWQADDGVMIPMVHETDEITETCENLWLRPSGADPWEFEVILMHIKGDSWTYKRDDRINLPIDAILWERDGIRYLRPEIQLLHKAPRLRPKDQADFEACVDLLEPANRAWLQMALSTAHPSHPWLSRL